MRQLVSPNLDPFIYYNFGQPSSGIVLDWLGWCAGYVAAAFNISVGYSAHSGQLSTTSFHADRNLPSGVYVPLWFDYFSNLDGTGVKNWGHVVIYKDGTIWSSPISHKAAADTWGSIEQVEQKYGVKYTGWSEDIATVRIVEESEVLNYDQVDSMAHAYLGDSIANNPGLQQYVGQSAESVIAAFNGAQQRADYLANIDNTAKQVSELEAEVASLKAQLSAPPEVPTNPTPAQETATGFIAWLKKFFGIK